MAPPQANTYRRSKNEEQLYVILLRLLRQVYFFLSSHSHTVIQILLWLNNFSLVAFINSLSASSLRRFPNTRNLK